MSKTKPTKASDDAKLVSKLTAIPKGDERMVDLDQLVFDTRLQQRMNLHDEDTVQAYQQLYLEGTPDTLGRISVCETADGKLFVFDGWQRCEAAKRAEMKSLPATVVKGTFDDARMWSLRANSDRGLSRTKQDCRRAVYSLLDTPELLQRAYDAAKGLGGFTRAAAILCGVSKGLISKVLEVRKQQVVRNKVVDLTPEAVAEKKVKKAKKGASDEPDLFAPQHDGPRGWAAVEAFEQRTGIDTPEKHQQAIDAMTNKVISKDAAKLTNALIKCVEAMLIRPELTSALHAAVNAHEADLTNHKIGKREDEVTGEKTPTWLLLQSVKAVFADVASKFADSKL